MSLNQLGHSYSGLSGKDGSQFGSGKPFIPYVNVYNNLVVNETDLKQVKIEVGEIQNTVKYGDALFTISSETREEVGISSVYLGNNEELYLNSFCMGFRLRNFNTLLPEYLPYFFSTRSFRRHVLPLAQGSTRYNLAKSDFMNIKFLIPAIEQQKLISATLHHLSKKLSIERETLMLNYKLKKHLIGKLFI